jgi:hypothetical protein
MKLEFSVQIFEKYSHIKFHEHPFSGSRVVPRERTDMKKVIVSFRNFVNAPGMLQSDERNFDRNLKPGAASRNRDTLQPA